MTVSDDEDGVILKRRKLYNVVKDESDDEENHITGLKSSIVKAEEGDEETKDAKLVNTDNDSPNSDDLEENVSDDLEEDYKWWEEQDKDDTIKWTTLEHNGVLFPPPYEALPSHVKLYYEGNPVDLPLEAEEVAGFFAHLLETPHAQNPVFQKNFFEDFKHVLNDTGGTQNGIEIESFDKMDFSAMHDYFVQLKEEKKSMTAMQKKEIRLEREKFEEKYKFCELDGRREQVGNFKVEPPDLFRGRGAHPKTGKLKRRIRPEDIVLNLGEGAPIPPPPSGHQWGEIRHDNTVQWLAMWRENIFGSFKYVRLAANSSLKGQSDFKKFEKARELKNHIDRIRKEYRNNFKSKLMVERQKAVAVYLIDVFALRAGGEKSEEEADTVGCCSLRYEHITLKPPNTVIFDFLGKDSIRFYQEVQVDPKVFKNLALFKKPPKQPGHQLFDRLDPSLLNKFLQNYMTGLTAKVFRTYNASKTMQEQLDLIPNEGSVAEKLLKYNAANRTVAILCNHQRTVTAGHAKSVAKSSDRIEEFKWQKERLKKGILQIEPDRIKDTPDYFEDINSIDKEIEAKIHERIVEREIQKYHNKFKRENDKRKFEGEEPLPEETLKEWLDNVKQLKQQYAEELATGIVQLKASMNSVEKLEKAIERLDQRISTSQVQLQDREANSEVSLGTSKINYIDPRLSVVFCKKYGVPIEKIFTKSLREKFKWAIESVDETWRF
ncbi:DNA topoisomerase 1 [Nakaseomyces glabratus]|uniref:DNA topoisomerase I n=1 Tax=Candida glabrata TaxID=5478 RepID=A0A0W0EED0_CANGB|nr:Eukaryotic DNA topoisomerase I, catalytic core [Nakaseomyces glabratus]KAH7605428.1 Eukaryotic DNA topoisomerase I, catalytic core [Nakaseomyces glabratus]KAH7614433.1 Eukaryotic DNA topoisomerase I, catalytic core [Nakaseomyces glabratus]KTA98900.1 DNA topoisomerase 1 [Nakaseomyces glabratus]KTB06308.1 DNA topoisomerase 1 [Nakaseomyces glabratus]